MSYVNRSHLLVESVREGEVSTRQPCLSSTIEAKGDLWAFIMIKLQSDWEERHSRFYGYIIEGVSR